MIRKVLTDEFFEKQPARAFEKDLREFEIPEISFAEPLKDEFSARGLYLEKGEFADEEKLQTAFWYLDAFLGKNGLRGNAFAVRIEKRDGLEKEEYYLDISENGCKISAGEREGVRRAIVAFEDILRKNGGNLKKGITHRKAVIKRRISRCFFSPTNRPPRNGAELDDDADYYPDGYLNRLMHDGINGIWIYSNFDSLLKSSYIPEFGAGSEKRIKKLNATIEKCGRYGIEVFLFAIEPIALTNPTVVKRHGELIHKYPQVQGNRFREVRGKTVEEEIAFCTYSEFGKGYCEEAMEKLFTLAPELGGFMSITQGERVTSCSTVYMDQEFSWKNTCPRCGKYSRAEILAQKIEVMREGMRKVKPQAEFISWTYEHRLWQDDDVTEYVKKAPDDVVLMQNFEDNGRTVQLGKERCAIDYWLAYDGPSHLFTLTAEEARKQGKRIYAKMQICCSHELASVPYIPVPGLIYDKLTRAKKLGVTGIMESWYFGNYPCLMSKAAEILSFDKEYLTKEAFLCDLASLYWKRSDAEKVARAWRCFEDAYTQYPVNVMFSYYGPAHDGIVWELALLPKNFSLSRSWQLIDRTDGDRLGECLFAGHTAEEASELLRLLNEKWGEGCRILSELSEWEQPFHEQISVVKALALLFDSAWNIVEFYRLRNLLGYGKGDARELLSKMKAIARREIENCRKMIPLCEADNRLGFHSEAEGYKFFPAKLERKIELTEKLLAEEFPLVEKRIEAGLSPLAYYDGAEEGVKRYSASRTGLENAAWEHLADGKAKFKIAVTDETVELELFSSEKTGFMICNEFELMFPSPMIVLKPDGAKALHRDAITHQSTFDGKIQAELDKWQIRDLATQNGETGTHLQATLSKKEVGFIRLPYKMLVRTTEGARWCEDPTPVNTLGKVLLSPADFGWIE